MDKRFLFVTANKNETAALLDDKDFFHYVPDKRSENPDDDNFYNIGPFGEYEVVHFELQTQGSVRSGSSLTSIYLAIDYWKPDAVILVGIAFGKDNEDTKEPRQHIGDVLVSTMMVDYESGKVKEGKVQSDAPTPESGKSLLAVFNHCSDTWNYQIAGRRAQYDPGLILSGDKVVDDPDFKTLLFNAYPRARGGEMEGRGAYSACRTKRIEEWIIVKAICDWGENKGNPNKNNDQVIAAKSAVSLLKHVFSNKAAFDKVPKKKYDHIPKTSENEKPINSTPLGYFISVGTTTCRLFEVIDKQTLHEVLLISYDIIDPNDEDYLAGIILHVKNEILPRMHVNPSQFFTKVFVDYNFAEVFNMNEDQSIQKDFIREFYIQTNLYFNILSKTQTVENLKRLFGDIPEKTAIIVINSHSVDVLEYTGKEFILHSLVITLADIREFVEQKNFSEIWTEENISEIKKCILKKIGFALDGFTVDNAIIIKDELQFMKNMGYPLKIVGGQLSLSQREYKRANHDLLYAINYRGSLERQNIDDTAFRRLVGFRYGHIVIETILDKMNNKRVIPKDDHSVHGSGSDAYAAYIFNVVISGSTHEGRSAYMIEARDRLRKMGANLLSPRINNKGNFEDITQKTEYEHLKAIDECDMLFICNKSEDGYIGESTKCEIYYAYALRKTIAFWHELPADNRLSFIPREHWGTVMKLEI